MAGHEYIGVRPRMWRVVAAAMTVLALGGCARTSQSGEAAIDPQDNTAEIAVPSALGSYMAARHAQQAHDYASAARLMERALADDPNNIDLVRRSFVMRLSEGRVGDAMPLARRLVDRDGNNGLAGVTLLIGEIKAGDFDAAAKRAQTLPREGAQRFAVPLLLAWIEAARNHPAQVRPALQQMGDLTGLEPLRDLHLGLIADLGDRIDEAQASYDKLLAEEPQPTFRVVETVGNFLERNGRSEAARRLYERFSTEEEQTEAAAAGIARIASGTLPGRIVATPQQGAAQALFDLASLLNQRDTVDAALIYVRLALELDPNFAFAQLLAAEIRDGQGRTEDALALYRAVDPKSPLASSAQLRVALSLDALGHADEAVAELQKMAAARPQSSDALVELGDILRSHSRYDEAVHAYDAAITRLPKPDAAAWRLYYDRGVSLERVGQWPRAEADLKQALVLQPDQPMVLNYLGYSWIDKGQNLPDALKMIQRAVELRPNDGYIVDSLGWAFYRLGDLARATQYLERAIELLPEDPTINDHLGDVYWRTGRVAAARFQWRRALQFGPEAGDAKTIETKLDRGLEHPPQAVSGN